MPLAAPTLSIVDHEDGTGATATISGGDAAATNTVSTQAVDGELGTAAWMPRGSRTGAGDVPLVIDVGYYWAQCQSSLGGETAIANLVYFHASSAAEAVHSRILAAVQARILSMTLPSIAADGVRVRKVALDRDVGDGLAHVLPCILIAPSGQEHSDSSAGTVTRDDVAYPVQVAIVAADNQDLEANLPLYLGWRERIARAFRNQKLSGVSEVFTCAVEPGAIVSLEAWRSNLWHSTLVLRFSAREPRGMT